MARSPEALGNAEDEAQIEREKAIERSRPEEGAMDEVVGDGVGGPPHSDRDYKRRWPEQEEQPLHCCQADQNRIPFRVEQRRGMPRPRLRCMPRLKMDWKSAHGRLGYFPRKVASATGPRDLSSSIQTRQVYLSPDLSCIFGDHSVCLSPWSTAPLLSFSPAAFSISKKYF